MQVPPSQCQFLLVRVVIATVWLGPDPLIILIVEISKKNSEKYRLLLKIIEISRLDLKHFCQTSL